MDSERWLISAFRVSAFLATEVLHAFLFYFIYKKGEIGSLTAGFNNRLLLGIISS
jgi:hypothetical protein